MEGGKSPGRDDEPRDPSLANRSARADHDGENGEQTSRPRGWRLSALLAAAAAVVLAGLLFLAPSQSQPAATLRTWLGLGSACGNGRVETGEECDDGNESATDRCLPGCRLATCGDGLVRAHVEECDDGNAIPDDGCSPSCLICPGGPDSFASVRSGHCYWRKAERLGWSQAAQSCAREGGHLVTFGDDDEWREINERLLAGGNAPAVWIGLRQEDRNGLRDFGWISGERLLSAHWGIQEPRLYPSDLDCGLQSEAGAWAAASCDEPHAFVCERPVWLVAPRDGHAYRRFLQRMIQPQASAACANLGGHLVTFSDANEQSFVGARFHGTFWIGSVLDDRTKRFVWATGEPLSYTDFAPGEPNFITQQKCLALEVDRRWYNRECDQRLGYVCEVE
jgi:cysteine-rich repeat protein